jgi:hypothetical protein
MVFPSTALPAFDPLQLIILVDDLPRLTTVLQEQGFEKRGDSFQKRFTIESQEPALASHSFGLTTRWQPQADKERLFDPESRAALSKRETAIRVIKNALCGASQADLDIEVTIEIYALEPEEILAYLCTRAANRDSKLLAGCDILEFFRVYGAEGWSVDWQSFLDTIDILQPESIESVDNSLTISYQALDAIGQAAIEEGFCRLQKRFPEMDLPSNGLRLFAWTRSGSKASARTDACLKKAFSVLLTFLSIERTSAKLAYLWQFILSTRSREETRYNSRQLVMDLLSLALCVLGPKKNEDHSSKDLVYWIE